MTTGVQVAPRTQHATSEEVRRQISERIGREELDDSCIAAIASWYQSPSASGMPFTLLAQGSAVDRTEMLDAIARERSLHSDPASRRELDMLATWVINAAPVDVPSGGPRLFSGRPLGSAWR